MAKRNRGAAGAPQIINLALQGGGAQGAFTWGVLDRLLEEEALEIGRVSGSSAGALNGAALLTGLARGGREGAKQHLERLWAQVAMAATPMTLSLLPLRKPGMGMWDDAMPLFSPYQTNPLGMLALRTILMDVVDEDALRGASAERALFVNAVAVQTGRHRVFGPEDISIDALLASGCAPLSFQAVQIDGQAYWDGSYAANPALWPLYKNNLDTDILLVELTPVVREETPVSAKNIVNRINELASVFGLGSELQALYIVNRSVDTADIRMHVLSIADQPAGKIATEPSIKRTVDRVLFEMLRQDGRRACEAWLADNLEHVGRRASTDLLERYASPLPSPLIGRGAAVELL